MAKESSQVNYITVAVTVILAVVFAIAIASVTNSSTSKTIVDNEQISLASAKEGSFFNQTPKATYTVAYAPTDWKSADCQLTSITVTNNSGVALTLYTDYNLSASTGVLTVYNTTANRNGFLGSNVSLVDYTYCGSGYLTSDWGRSVLNTNVGLYVLAILILAVGLAYYFLKRED